MSETQTEPDTVRDSWAEYVQGAERYAGGHKATVVEQCAFYGGAAATLRLLSEATCCPAHMFEKFESLLRELESITHETQKEIEVLKRQRLQQ